MPAGRGAPPEAPHRSATSGDNGGMTATQVLVPIVSATIGTIAGVFIARWNRSNQRGDRREDRHYDLERERRDRHAQRFARDYESSMELLDVVHSVASEIQYSPKTREELDKLELPTLVQKLGILAQKLNKDRHGEVVNVQLFMARIDSKPLPDYSRAPESTKKPNLTVIVDTSIAQAGNAVSIMHHLEACRDEIREAWGPPEPD